MARTTNDYEISKKAIIKIFQLERYMGVQIPNTGVTLFFTKIQASSCFQNISELFHPIASCLLSQITFPDMTELSSDIPAISLIFVLTRIQLRNKMGNHSQLRCRPTPTFCTSQSCDLSLWSITQHLVYNTYIHAVHYWDLVQVQQKNTGKIKDSHSVFQKIRPN